MSHLDIEPIFEAIKRSLSDFSPTSDSCGSLMFSDDYSRFPIDRTELPVPELIKFLLGGILKCKVYGPAEKVRWEVLFKYEGHLCSFALEKFGLRLYVSDVENISEIRNQIVGKMSRVIRKTETKLFTPFAKEQIKENNVIIANNYYRLEERYLFFKDKVEEELKPKETPEVTDISMLSIVMNSHVQSQKNVLYYALAMLDAYFSYLEHLFVLLYPLSTNSKENIDLVKFMSSAWGDKFQLLFDFDDAKVLNKYNSLKNIKEKYRNYYAHGAFEKRGASLYFNFPGLGALPALLSNRKEKPHFSFFTDKKDMYSEITTVINEFNIWLRSDESKMKLPIVYIKSGLDIPCDQSGLEELKNHFNSEDSLNELINYHSHISDIHDNMDY